MKKFYLLFLFSLLYLSHTKAQSLTGASPSASNISETVSVTLNGNNCQFTQSAAGIQVWMSAVSGGATVFTDQLQVTSNNQLVCTFTFTSALTVGWYNINVYQNGFYYLTLPYGFNLSAPLQPFSLTGITPAAANAGQVINVTISGQGGSFAQGTATTAVTLNRFTTTLSADVVTPVNNNQLTAQFTLSNGIPTGPYNVVVNNSIDGSRTLTNGFTVNPNPNPPLLTQIQPNNGMQSSNLTVNISGQNTHFGQGSATVWFSQGSSTVFYSGSLFASSTTQLSAYVQIPGNTPTGMYDLHVQNSVDGHLVMNNAFLVNFNPNAPQLVSVSPNQGQQGQMIPVTITGQNTNFTQGTATVNFTQGSSTLNVYSVSITDDTHMQGFVDVSSWAPLGWYQANVYHSYDGYLSLPNSFEVTGGCGSYAYVVQQPCANSPAVVFINSFSPPPFTVVISGTAYTSNSSSFSFYPPQNMTYFLQGVYDQNGCAAVLGNTYINASPLSVSLSSSAQACVGGDIIFSLNVSDLSQVYSYGIDYGDGTSGTSTTHSYSISGNYLPVLTMSTTCGYINVPSNYVNILPSPLVQTTVTPASCGQNNGSISISAFGSGPFSYSLNTALYPFTAQTIYNNLAPGTYPVTVMGGNSCTTVAPVSLGAQTSVQNISGILHDANGNPAGGHYLALYAWGNSQPAYTTVTGAAGDYSFSNLVTGDYLLAAIPNPNLNPNLMRTYSPHTAFWENADTIHISCTTPTTRNIEFIANNVLAGNCSLDGYVLVQPNQTPMAYAEVVLYDFISQVPFKAVLSGVDGYFSFANIPPMNYGVKLEIPFASTAQTFNYSSCYMTTSFLVDTANNTYDALLITGNNKPTDAPLRVYPNPFAESLVIEGTLYGKQSLVTLSDVTGKILLSETLGLPSGPFRYEWETTHLPAGVYLLQLRSGDTLKTLKVFKQ